MYAVLHVPQFALQAVLRHQPERWLVPTVLIDPSADVPRVVDLTAPARAAGISPGQTAPQALARCREVVVQHRSSQAETIATDALLQTAFGFSPHLEETAPGTATLDLRGLLELRESSVERVDPSLASWAARFQDSIASLGFQSRLGVARTPLVARHAARWSVAGSPGVEVNGPVAIVQDAHAFLRGLPLAALEPSSHVAEILRQWGVSDVGGMMALGQAELADRLGLEALGLFAAASVDSARPLRLIRPVDRFEEGGDLAHPVETLEPLLFRLRRYVDSLASRLESLGWVAEVLVLRLQLESGTPWERRLSVPQPTRRADVLFRMLETHLENVRTDAPVVGVGLVAEPARPVERQFGLFEAMLKDPHQFQETLARLSALVGSGNVGSPVREDSHRPDAFRLVPPDFEAPPRPRSLKPEFGRKLPWRRMRPAVPARVDLAENENVVRPVAIRCVVSSGRVVSTSGPWDASGRWWEPEAWQREEWDVALRDGAVLRLVNSAGAWMVEGILD